MLVTQTPFPTEVKNYSACVDPESLDITCFMLNTECQGTFTPPCISQTT